MPPFEPRVFTAGSEERVACLPPQGLPEPSMWWEHVGVRLPTHGRVYQKGRELVFASIAESDAGVYTCHAANLAGQRRQDVNITVANFYNERTYKIRAGNSINSYTEQAESAYDKDRDTLATGIEIYLFTFSFISCLFQTFVIV
ncbi:PREDICTED: inactive tyrosine-protein kinase 7-like [Myotis brandtii]|uniref:inactive tyrosine-protein kinase 7-like n=1 Tax=Myotis brandtii TaxID=109478 RepID=UPI000703EB61|nr:PREDICTED: inactive tyrosine-protein kinase 7-like [Myotis brandtii]